MKANDLFISKRLKKDLRTVYVLAIVSSIILIGGWGVLNTPDSSSYILAWSHYSKGEIDMLRTPVYPVYLGILRTLFGDAFCFVAICIQHLIFLFSIRYFYKIALYILQSINISFWLTLFYALFPCITTWNNFILTESFAISGTIFLLSTVISLNQKFSYKALCGLIVLSSLLVLLRPALVYILPVLFVAWVFQIFKRGSAKVATMSIVGVMVATTCLVGYMKAFEHAYGFFASSSVGTFNQVCIAYEDGLLNPDVIEDEKLKADALSHQLWENNSLKDVNDVIVTSYKSQPTRYIQKCYGHLYRSRLKSLFLTLAPGFSTVFDLFGFGLNTLYLFVK